MQIGIDSFVQVSEFGESAQVRTAQLLDEIVLADRFGIHTFGVGEHHREEYLASAPAMFLAAAAARTERIRLSSAVTVLSSDDPVRVYQDFATLDLISNGRAEIVVGRGSFVESYALFGFNLQNYDDLFAEKLDLLLKIREQVNVTWEGKHRAALSGQEVYPRAVQEPLPVRLGVGGTPQSFARAGMLGLPLTVAIIGGEPHRFRPLVDLYRQAWKAAGHDPAKADVAVQALGFLAETDDEAAELYWPAYEKIFTCIGKERGWGPITRRAFDQQLGPEAAFLIGSPATVAAKMQHYNDVLGGISRIGVHMSGGGVPHAAQMRAIELLGTIVEPIAKI